MKKLMILAVALLGTAAAQAQAPARQHHPHHGHHGKGSHQGHDGPHGPKAKGTRKGTGAGH